MKNEYSASKQEVRSQESEARMKPGCDQVKARTM